MVTHNSMGNAPVALITGAGRGIGRATALALAAVGYDVAVNFLQNRSAAEKTAAEIRALGRRSMVNQADVADMSSVTKMVAEIEAELGHIDALINNAGIGKRVDTVTANLEDWDISLRTNLTSCFICTKAVLPSMMAHGRGVIVNVASIAGLTGGLAGPHYAAAKGGVIALTKYLGQDLARYGIRVNAVAPTLTDTDMLKDLELSASLEHLVASRPMKRLIQPDEVASVIVFLLSDQASYVSGECIRITGGN